MYGYLHKFPWFLAGILSVALISIPMVSEAPLKAERALDQKPLIAGDPYYRWRVRRHYRPYYLDRRDFYYRGYPYYRHYRYGYPRYYHRYYSEPGFYIRFRIR